MTKQGFLITSESVTEGHPDKVADQISDGVLDAILHDDPMGRVACECLVTTGLVMVAGEISTTTYVDIPRLAREIVKDIGYTRAKYGFDGDTCAVLTSIDEQSGDIAQGVDKAMEIRGMLFDALHHIMSVDRRESVGNIDTEHNRTRVNAQVGVEEPEQGSCAVLVHTILLIARRSDNGSMEFLGNRPAQHTANHTAPTQNSAPPPCSSVCRTERLPERLSEHPVELGR